MVIKDNTPGLPIASVFPILRFAIDKGIEAKSLFKETSLTESDLFDLQNIISVNQELTIIKNLNRILPEPEIAWELGRYFTAGFQGDLGCMLKAATTFGDVISCIIDYSILSHSHFRFYPESVGKKIRLYFMKNNIPDDLLPFLVERDLISGITDIENTLPVRKSKVISGVCFAHEPRTEVGKYKKIFIENVSFNHPITYIEFNKSSFNIPKPGGDKQEFALFRQQCQAKYSLHGGNRDLLTDRVRLCIQTGSNNIRLTHVAKQLNMSERSLRRQLSNEGISFREIKNQFIFQQSIALLRDPTLHIQEISEILGYSEISVFTRAFQKWTGVSPGRFRKD